MKRDSILPANGNTGDIFVAQRGDATAVIDLTDRAGPREVTYAQLNAGCRAVARGLRRIGLGQGDRVALMSGNRTSYYEFFFGALRAGCVPMQINIRLTAPVLKAVIEEAEPALIFTDAARRGSCPEGARIVLLDDDEGLRQFVDPGPFNSVVPDPNDVAFMPYTSGTTGTPKGIQLTHRNSMWALSQMVAVLGDTATEERMIIAHPLYHKNAMLGSKSMFLGGGSVVMLDRFNEEAYLAAVERYRVTKLHTVPTMMARIVAQEDLMARYDLSSVRDVHMGSGPISEKLFDTVKSKFSRSRLRISYGLTEAGPMQFGAHPGGVPTPRMSVGYRLPECELRFASGSESEGVLQIRNPGVMTGYFRRDDETKKRLMPEGWIDSGDILRRDKDGFYYFVGRVDDMFVVGGSNLYPAAVEEVILRHPNVAEAAVVAIDDDVRGQVPHAFVVARQGQALTEKEVKDFVIANAPPYWHPRRVYFLDALPLHGTSKVDVRELRRRAKEAIAGSK